MNSCQSPVCDNDSSKQAQFHNEEQFSLFLFSSSWFINDSFQYCFFDYYNSINKVYNEQVIFDSVCVPDSNPDVLYCCFVFMLFEKVLYQVDLFRP